MDEQQSDRPKLASKPVIHIEVATDRMGKVHFWQVLVSVPGRESMSTRTWSCPSGNIDDGQMVDITSFIDGLLTDAIYTYEGVQQRLGAID